MAFKGTSVVVTTSGTEVPLSAADLHVSSFVLVAKAANTGNIFVSDSTVSTTTNGGLRPGAVFPWGNDPPVLYGINLKDIYIDAAVNGEGVDLWYNSVG
jgi:hypothetical protein